MKSPRFARDGYIFISVIFYVLSLVYMFWSEIPPFVLCMIGGIVLIAYGIIRIIGFFSVDLYCLAFQNDLAFGTLMILVGGALLVFNLKVIDFLPIGLGWLALTDSLFKIQMARDARRFGLTQWNIILIVGLLTSVLSICLILQHPPASGSNHIITGIVLFSEGIMNHCVVLCTVKLMKKTS